MPHGSEHGPEAVGGGALERVAGAEGGEQCEEEKEEEEDGRPPGEEADQEGQGDRRKTMVSRKKGRPRQNRARFGPAPASSSLKWRTEVRTEKKEMRTEASWM